MAKELMEIGGFITSGAEIVNHDASLSGNGTVASPLGVVPTIYKGYNTSSPVFKSLVYTDFYVAEVYGIKVGSIVTLHGNFNPMAKQTYQVDTWTKIGEINDDLKPNYTVTFGFTCYENPDCYGWFEIRNNGEIFMRQHGTTGGSWGRIFDITYNLTKLA